MNRFACLLRMSHRQTGLTYVEVLIAIAIIAVALVPALEALHTGMLGTEIHQASTSQHYAVTARMEEMLAEQHGVLVAAAAITGGPTMPSSYSDPAGTPDRRLVYVALYDADNLDGDGDVFTVLDPNLDGDSDPYTGFTGLVWVRVELEGSVIAFESLSAS